MSTRETDRVTLISILMREPTEEELESYSSLLDANSKKIQEAYNKYYQTSYRGEAIAGMVWAEVNYKFDVISCGAEPEIQRDSDLLFPAIAAAINEANKKSTTAYKEYTAEYVRITQEIAKEIQAMFGSSDSSVAGSIDPKLLN